MNNYTLNSCIFIIVGAGFIGSHFCVRLSENGHDMLFLDYLFTCTEYKIMHLLAYPNFKFIHYDSTFSFYIKVDETHFQKLLGV